MCPPDVAEFDRWYEVVAGSLRWRPFVAEHLELPGTVLTTGFLGGGGLTEIGDRLDLGAGDTLIDLGCGRAGFGLSLVRDVGARLIGVDFSPVALRDAATDAAALGVGDRASFHRGDLAATGLPDQVATAIVCVDALQFAESVPAALDECARLLTPGGRIAISTWQCDPTDDRVPSRIRRMTLLRDLRAAGFTDVLVERRPEWSATEARLWTAAAEQDIGEDAALLELRAEAAELLPLAGALHRVLALGHTPT